MKFTEFNSQLPQNGKFFNTVPNEAVNDVKRFELVNSNGELLINVNGKLVPPEPGRYTFVNVDGKIIVGEGTKPFHVDLSTGAPVNYAGELNIANTNGSSNVGH